MALISPAGARRHGAVVVMATVAVLIAAGCSSGSSSGADQVVLADGQELGSFSPMLGYGQLGVSPIYEGLLRPSADDDARVPDLEPSLASAAPESLGDRQWLLPLREGVRFSDGTTLDAADVIATYDAVRNPTVASEIATDYAPIASIAADGPTAVTVTMPSPVATSTR